MIVTNIITEYPHFFTATILEWKKLLKPDKYKDVIIESMRFLVIEKRVIIYGFVIMINHIHIVANEHGVKNVYIFMGQVRIYSIILL